jgi:hypothetical protein
LPGKRKAAARRTLPAAALLSWQLPVYAEFPIRLWEGGGPGTVPLLLETSAEHSAKSKGMICPISLWSGRRCHLFDTLAQPKHDSGHCPLRFYFLTELLFQAFL